MLSSITPFGERGRHNRFGVTATAFVIGAISGGTALGVLAGLLGSWLPARSAGVDALQRLETPFYGEIAALWQVFVH